MTGPIVRPQTLLQAPAQWALLVGFATLLALPSLDWAQGIDPTPPPEENRTPAPQVQVPKTLLAMAAWPAAYEAWFKDHFGLRNTLIAWHSTLMLDWFGVSPSKDVLIGKDGWLFLGATKNVDAYRCVAPYTPKELEDQRKQLVATRDWLRDRGIAYLKVWVPIKANIYPEFLPNGLTKLAQPCRMAQWFAHMAQHTDVAVLDLTGPLLAEKARNPERLYFKTDTHWNPRGAWAGYQALVPLLRKLAPKADIIIAQRVSFHMRSETGGDLAKLLDMTERYRGSEPIQAVANSRIQTVDNPVQRPKGIHLWTLACQGCGKAKLLMFHDSFGNHLRTFLAESFARTVSVEFGPFDKELVQLEKPDIVIEVHLERQMTPER